MSKLVRFLLLLPVQLLFPTFLIISAVIVFDPNGISTTEWVVFTGIILYDITAAVAFRLTDKTESDEENQTMVSRTFFFPNNADGDKELEKFVRRTGCRVKQIKESVATTMLIVSIDEEELSEEAFRRALLRDTETLKSLQNMSEFSDSSRVPHGARGLKQVSKSSIETIENNIRLAIDKLDKYRENNNEQ